MTHQEPADFPAESPDDPSDVKAERVCSPVLIGTLLPMEARGHLLALHRPRDLSTGLRDVATVRLFENDTMLRLYEFAFDHEVRVALLDPEGPLPEGAAVPHSPSCPTRRDLSCPCALVEFEDLLQALTWEGQDHSQAALWRRSLLKLFVAAHLSKDDPPTEAWRTVRVVLDSSLLALGMTQVQVLEAAESGHPAFRASSEFPLLDVLVEANASTHNFSEGQGEILLSLIHDRLNGTGGVLSSEEMLLVAVMA